MRVNARLDEATQQQIEYLTQTTGQSVSHVLRESVAHYYVQVKQQQRPPSRFLALAGTGSSGLGDLSTNVKKYVAEALAQKYPQHMGATAAPRKRKARAA
jgi:predicted transcriptional regulator